MKSHFERKKESIQSRASRLLAHKASTAILTTSYPVVNTNMNIKIHIIWPPLPYQLKHSPNSRLNPLPTLLAVPTIQS